jgi:hypothetical protein
MLISAMPSILNGRFARLIFLTKPNDHLRGLLVNVSRECDLGAAFGCERLIDAVPSIHKVTSPMLLSWRNAAMQFCVVRSGRGLCILGV